MMPRLIRNCELRLSREPRPEQQTVLFQHGARQAFEADLGLPTERIPGRARRGGRGLPRAIAQAEVYWCGRVRELLGDADKDCTGLAVHTNLVRAGASPLQRAPRQLEAERTEVPDRAGLARNNEGVLRIWLLQRQPNSLRVVPRMAPIPLLVQADKLDPLFEACHYASHRRCDPPGQGAAAAAWRLVAAEDTTDSKHAVDLSVVLHRPVIRVGRCIRKPRCLNIPDRASEASATSSTQKVAGGHAVHLQVVDLNRAHLLQKSLKASWILVVACMELDVVKDVVKQRDLLRHGALNLGK
mmetsp:Transcript_98811/g.247696  ORF Transcript_98811/g.247696 Transcript_98811/m.247696 type:complete len:299 (+) Transcript_98811:116-1012(+)